MAQLRQDYQKFTERQAEIIVVGPENEDTFKDYWLGEKMPFPGIADPQHVIAGQYGQEVKILKTGRMPALFVIDKAGLMRFKHYGRSMSDIPRNEDIFGLLDTINK